MRIATEHDEENASMINLTPLVDVVFLLLIFFMVTATFQNDERDLTIEVPDAENSDPLEDLPETLVVGVRRDGSFTLGSHPLDREELRATLVKARRKNPKQQVVVRADREVPVHFPVAVLDLCAGLSIETSIATAAPSPR